MGEEEGREREGGACVSVNLGIEARFWGSGGEFEGEKGATRRMLEQYLTPAHRRVRGGGGGRWGSSAAGADSRVTIYIYRSRASHLIKESARSRSGESGSRMPMRGARDSA